MAPKTAANILVRGTLQALWGHCTPLVVEPVGTGAYGAGPGDGEAATAVGEAAAAAVEVPDPDDGEAAAADLYDGLHPRPAAQRLGEVLEHLNTTVLLKSQKLFELSSFPFKEAISVWDSENMRRGRYGLE